MEYRIGHGYDIHRLVAGRKLILGGVVVPFELGCAGHSDGDALCHAIADALLGAAGLGDIGEYFPDTDESIAGISSQTILAEVIATVKKHLWRLNNIDATVVLERPKLAEHIPAMREKLAHLFRLPAEHINVKAKTGEGLGPVGEGLAVEVHAVVSIVR